MRSARGLCGVIQQGAGRRVETLYWIMIRSLQDTRTVTVVIIVMCRQSLNGCRTSKPSLEIAPTTSAKFLTDHGNGAAIENFQLAVT